MEERLRKLTIVVETGSFTRAAAELHISQPALSVAIAKLERELKTKLFVRRQPPLRLTVAGESAYRYAKSLGARNRNFKLELAELNRQKPTLTIGMTDSMAYTLFVYGDVFGELKQQADVSLTVHNSRSLGQQLQKGELDIALLTSFSGLPERHIRTRPLGDEPLVAVSRHDQAPFVVRTMEDGMLPGLLSYDQKSYTDHLISQYFTSRGIELTHIFRSTSPEILLHMALAGEGVAILPYLMVRQAIAEHKLAITAGPIVRPIVALEHKDRETSLPLLMLCKRVRQALESLNAEDDLK